MMKESWMEVLPPVSHYFSSPSWLLSQKSSSNWTKEENKLFENALAWFGWDWERVAAAIPGKTVLDVMAHYHDLELDVNQIEAGLIPFPGYSSSAFTLDWDNNNGIEGMKQSYLTGGKRPGSKITSDQERKKGIPWTQEEHKLFLMGLKRYGKGDWRSISRNFVLTRTPTQVASHAQKYFIRLNSGSKDKRRPSIHDITTNNLPESKPPPLQSQPSILSIDSASVQHSIFCDSKQHYEAKNFLCSSVHGNVFV